MLSVVEIEMREVDKGWEVRYNKMNEVERKYKARLSWMKRYNEGKEVKKVRERSEIGPLMKNLKEEEESDSSSSSSESEMDERDQLVYVLPKEDSELLKEVGIEGVNERIYTEEKELEWSYKRRIWESKVKLQRIRKRGKKYGEENLYITTDTKTP
jgi:hypothetical protein